MKLVSLSDTHNQLHNVTIPDGDVLLYAGDLTGLGTLKEITKELETLKHKTSNFKKVILVAGNHDWLAQKEPLLMQILCAERDFIYLNNSDYSYEGVKFYGSPHSPEFCNWAFGYAEDEAEALWSGIPNDVNVLITHSPPYGILDSVRNRPLGCLSLRGRIEDLKELKLHVFGHIHESAGQCKVGDTTFVNAAICDGAYRPTNRPIVIEI